MIFYNNCKIKKELKNYIELYRNNFIEILYIEILQKQLILIMSLNKFIIHDIYVKKFKEILYVFLYYYSKILKFIIVIYISQKSL